jgi:hypothetical protein
LEKSSEKTYNGPIGPVVGSIMIVIGWLAFILLYALYWSKGFDLFQNIVVAIVSFAIAALIMGAMWLIWYHPTGELRDNYKEKIQI